MPNEFHETNKNIASGTPCLNSLAPALHHRARCHHAKGHRCIWNASLPPTTAGPTPPCQMPPLDGSPLHLEHPLASHIHHPNITVPDAITQRVLAASRTPACLLQQPVQHHRARCHHSMGLPCIWNTHLPPTYTIPTSPCQMPSLKGS